MQLLAIRRSAQLSSFTPSVKISADNVDERERILWCSCEKARRTSTRIRRALRAITVREECDEMKEKRRKKERKKGERKENEEGKENCRHTKYENAVTWTFFFPFSKAIQSRVITSQLFVTQFLIIETHNSDGRHDNYR